MVLTVSRNRDEGRERVGALVAQFAADEAYYKSGDFDELSARVQFIGPFFEAHVRISADDLEAFVLAGRVEPMRLTRAR